MFTNDDSDIEKILILCFVIFDSLQGFFLFCIFTWTERVGECAALQCCRAVLQVWGLYCAGWARLRGRAALRREQQASPHSSLLVHNTRIT